MSAAARCGKTVQLAGGKMNQEQKLQLETLHNQENYTEMINLIKALPVEEVDFEAKMLLAQAYLGNKNQEAAIKTLFSVKAQGAENFQWNFLLATELHQKEADQAALPYFVKAQALDPANTALVDLIKACEESNSKYNRWYPCAQCGSMLGFQGICYRCKTKKQREDFLALTPEEMTKKVQDVIARIETITDWEEVYRSSRYLLAYHDINTAEIARAAFEKDIFYPAYIYQNAPDDIVERMLAWLKEEDCKNAGELMCCLAAKGGAAVQNVFYELENYPRKWRKKLYVGPSRYAWQGGWTFDSDNQHRQLIFDTCYTVLPSESGKREDDAVVLAKPREGENCAVCGCQIVDMITIDGCDERLAFLGLEGTFTAPVCPNCIMFAEEYFAPYTLDGKSPVVTIEGGEEQNYISENDMEEMQTNSLTLGKAPVPLYYSHGCEETVTIGGHADWIQDHEFATCPQCQKTMMLLAAIPWEALYEGTEGTLYVEICKDCQMLHMLHQQT